MTTMPNDTNIILSSDPLRPQAHFLAPYGWMNDPCGPIYAGGKYHLFYQWNKDAAKWGNIHWGHATSFDLIHWKHEPTALYPQKDGADKDGVFTGDVVDVDGKNAVALYTGFRSDRPLKQVQCIATSDIEMIHWKQEPKPFLDVAPDGLEIDGFRDPKVWRENGKYIMILGSSIKGKGGVVFRYEGTDLRHWIYKGILYGPSNLSGTDDDALECPDFFPLGNRHVLIFSINSVVYAVVGEYKNAVFTPLSEERYGHGNIYAARTFIDSEGQRVLFGWITERISQEKDALTRGWSGVMSFPRILYLTEDGHVGSKIYPTIQAIEGGLLTTEKASVDSIKTIPDCPMHLKISFETRYPGEILFSGISTFLCLNYNPGRLGAELLCNGETAPLSAKSKNASVDVYIDASVIEIVTSSGSVLNARAYGDASRPLKVDSFGSLQAATCDISLLTPISGDRLSRAAKGEEKSFSELTNSDN